MKKIIYLFAFVLISSAAIAQSPSDLFIKKYEGKKGFTTVNISEKMFELVATVAPEQEAELKELADGLKGIKVLVYENEDGSYNPAELYKEAEGNLKFDGFEELMNVYSDGEKVRILSSQSSPDILDELIIVVGSEDEFVLVDIFGKIDLNKISKMAGSIDIEGLEHLENLEK